MSALSTSSYKPGIILCLVIFLVPQSTHSAPVYDQDTTQVAEYDGGATGCYYNFQHYQESDRIITNEPCLNCTCHNRMLMCYLRVCPFSKAIGQDCTVEKRPDQCCPVITCPEVPVQLLTSTTNAPATSDSTEIGFRDNYGCKIDDRFYPDGAQLPLDPQNPCELCYCIKNRTTCVIQECTLRVAGCKPAYQPGVCCPVKYNCEYDEELETTVGPISGLIMTTTIAPGATPQCYYEGKFYEDGELIYSTQPCQHCYCFRGDIACAVQDCGTPMKTHGENCTALPPPEGECCPTTYHCEDNGQSESITIPEGIEQTSEINQVQPIVTIPEKVEEPEEQEFEITSEAFPGADNAIPHDHEVKTEQTEESIKAVESTEKSTETTEEKEVTESETMYGSGEVNLPEEHDIELTPVNIPNTEIKSTEETQTIQNQNTEAPILIKETEKPISIEQTETPVPTEKITPIYTEKSEIPLVAENTEKPITIEETKTHVSEEETEIPITLEKSEDSSTKPSEGVQEAIEISITENVPTVSPSLEGLETETETAKKDQKIEQPESTEENVTLEEHQTQAITIEGAMKTEELTEPLISEQDHTESTYELVPSEETTNPQEPDGESGKSTEVIVSTEGVSEKTTETISQYESTTKLVENEEQSSLETKESEIPQEITEKVTTLNPEKSPIAEVTESEKPVEISESGKVEPTEITTSLLGVQETEQQYPPAEQKPKSPEPELELKEKLPPLAPKRDDFGSPEVDINQHPFVKEPHETEVDEQIFENIPGYKTEDKESIPEIHIIESNVDIKKPEMHAPESLVTETPEKALTSETASSTITKHEENEIETETKVEKPIEETIPDQKETSTTEITPTALDTKASHTPELHVSTEAQTVQEELEHTEKSIIPEDYVTGTIGPEIHLTEKITTVEELPTKGLTLGEFGETSSEEVSSETSNGNEEIMPGKEQFNEKEGEAEEKLQKPSSEEISTESSISEQESTSIPASEKSVEEGVDTISEISPTEKQPEIPQSEIQPTETSTEEEVTIKETEQKESIETPKISPPSETEQKEFMETSEVSKPSVTHTVNEVDVSETKAPEEPEIVKVTESTAVSEEATIVSEIVSEESTTKQTEEISTKEHILETSEITENIIPEEVSEQSVIPNNKSTESIEIAEAYTSVPSVIEEEPVVEEKSTEMPSLIEKEHTPTLISKEKSIEESEEEKKSEIIPTKEELTEKTPTTETQMTEKSTVKEELEEEKETESSVTGKYTTEISTVEVKGTEIISEQSTEKISEDEEQKIQKPSFEEEKSTESTVGEGKEPIDSLEKKLTEIITEEKTTKISIPEQPETSTMISEGENDVFEDNIREQSTEQAAVSETFSGQPTVSESTTELFSGTIPPVIESKVPIESHIEEKKQPETETSVTKEPSTEIPIQQEESTSIESISEKLIPEKQEGVVSTTKITDEINGSTSQPEESSKESTEAAIPVESSMITKEQEIEEHTEGISEEKSDEEKDHELTSSVGISTEETSSEVPIIKETTEIPEAEEKLHKTTLEIDEEKTTTKSIETHEEQSTIAPFKEEISGVKLTSPSLIITGIPSERPIEYSTEQQLADITEIIPTNEITESAESKPTSSDIPGEGNCLVDGQSYNNNSAIPPANPCQLSCQCISSIIQCELMLCPPPPTHLSNCMPVHTSGSSCCPIYTCDSTPTIELEADNHMIEHHTPKYEESEKPEHITSIPKVTEIPSAFSDHTGEGEDQEHVSSYPHTLETVSEHGSEIGKEEEAVEERITINPIESVSEESTITQEHKNLQEVSSKETFNIPLSEQSTTESTLSITTQKTVEVTEQEKEIVKFLPSTEESIVEQITEKVTSFPVAVETETTVLMEESEKMPEEGTEEGVSNEATEQTMSEASISTTAETMSEASISTTAETISEASISTVSEISNEVTEEQSKESETFGGIQEVIVSTEHGITSTEEEITQSAETEGQTKIEIETTKEKEQPDNLIEVTSERPTEHYTEQEFTDITKLVTTSEVSSQAPEEAKPTPVEHQTVEPESETTNINVSESNTEISTKIDLLITEDQTDISKATTTIKSESVSSYEEITTPTIESNQSTKIQESEILDEEKDKTIEQTTKSVEKSTEISTQQPTDQTDIPMVTEKQSIVHIEETPIPVTSKDTESSISTKTESTEPTVIVETETPLSSVEKHTEPTISVETQTSTLVSVEEHESEEIPKKSESAEKQKEEKPLEVTTTEKEISEPIEVEVTEHSIPSADSTTPTIEKHVTTTIEEQTMKFEETSTKEPIQEYTTLSISPIYEETIATSTLSNEKTSESIPMEEEQTKEKTLENIEGETVGPNTIIEEQTISSNVPIIHAEEEHQPEEITQKPFKEEATTSISITEIQPTLAVNEKTQQHLGEEISFNIEGTSTEKSESVAAEVTEQTKQIEEQKPKKEEQVGEGQPIETSEVSEVTETLVTFKEKPVESSIPEEKPTESPTLEEKPTESLTLEEKPTESPTLEEKLTESPTLEEKPTESPTLEGKPTESSILEEKPTESPTLEEKPTESPILEEKPVESSTLEEEPIESSTPEEKQSDVYITSESSAASESSTPSESFTPSESSTSSEPTTSKEKLIESSTSEGQLLESTSQENPIESLTPEEKPIEPLIPIEDHTETEQKTETPISKGETLKPSTYEGEIEKTSEQTPLEETQTTVEESVSKIPVIISSTETVQTELIEEQKGGETEEHSVTPIEEEKSETPESTESILIKEQEPTEGTTITDHLVSEEKATTVSTIREEEVQSTEAPAPTKEAPSKGEVEFPLAETEASSEVTIKEQSTTEPISEESITKSDEAEKGKEEITESTLPKEKPIPTSLSSITEEPEEKMTSGPVVTEEQELEILSVKPEKEQETTESSTEGFITKLRPIPTELSITETSEKISESDHEEGQEEVQSHIGITQPESSSQIPQTDKSEGQLTVGLDEEHLQPVNHTIETSEPILEEHHVTSSVTPQTGVEYPEQTVSGEDNPHFPMHGGSYLNPDEDYDEDDQAIYGPGTCRYGGKVYMSAQQIPRDDPCDFCFCFRSDIICLQQSCPPPIPGCHEEPISGFCCPRYECPVSMATSLNITTTTTTTTTTLPPHFLTHAYKGAAKRSGCQIRGQAYHVGEVITSASGPCLHCTCGGDGNMKCDPRVCSPEPMLRQMIAAATARRRR